MVMVLAVGRRRLVARDSVAGIDTLDQPQIRERLERPVDGRDADRAARLAQLVVDVLRAEAAVLAAEEVDDRRPRAAAAIAGGLARVFRPAHRRAVYLLRVDDENRSHYRLGRDPGLGLRRERLVVREEDGRRRLLPPRLRRRA